MSDTILMIALIPIALLVLSLTVLVLAIIWTEYFKDDWALRRENNTLKQKLEKEYPQEVTE